MTPLDIPLRGAREYVQASDLFAALESLAKARFSAGAHLRKLALRKLFFHEIETHFEESDAATGTFEICEGQTVASGWLVETGRNIQRRIPYDETPVVNAAIVHPGRVLLREPVDGYTCCDQMLVLSKILGAQIRAGAWLFTMLELTNPFQEQLPLELILLQNILGRGLIAEVRQYGRAIGRTQLVLRGHQGVKQ